MRFFAICFTIVMALIALVSGACNEFCPRNIDSICGQHPDGKMETFSNPCEMQKEICLSGKQITVLYRGICPQ